ncbi:MAG: hypothetical protein AAGD07_03060 [Planctomycetota bacterium]
MTSETIAQSVLLGQIITFGMAKGIVVITFVLLFASGALSTNEPSSKLWLLGLLMLPLGLTAAFLVPKGLQSYGIARFRAFESVQERIASRNPKDRQAWVEWGDRERLPLPLATLCRAERQSRLVGQAILDGVGVCNAVFMVISNNPWPLVAIGIIVFGILAITPTQGRLRGYFETALDPRLS